MVNSIKCINNSIKILDKLHINNLEVIGEVTAITYEYKEILKKSKGWFYNYNEIIKIPAKYVYIVEISNENRKMHRVEYDIVKNWKTKIDYIISKSE